MTSTVPLPAVSPAAAEDRRRRRELERLRALAGRLRDRREKDARRIARQLEHEVGEITGAAQLTLAATVRQLPPGPLRDRLLWLDSLMGGLEDRLRRIAHELRPTLLDEQGLGPALGFLAEDFSSRAHVPVEIDGDLVGLPAEVETALYRAIEEALANVEKHARARRVSIRLETRRGRLFCSVRDDGAGFEPGLEGRGKRKDLGLLGIRERLAPLGGRLEVRSAPAHGTELVLTVPLRSRAPRSA